MVFARLPYRRCSVGTDEAQLDAIRSAGFDGVTGRVGRQHGKLAKEREVDRRRVRFFRG